MLTFLSRAATVALVLLVAAPAAAQPTVAAGAFVDTLGTGRAWAERGWKDDVRPIFEAWREHLRASADGLADTARWLPEERALWPAHDASYVMGHYGMPATVLEIRPAGGSPGGEYVVRTLFAMRAAPGEPLGPYTITRTYAARRDGRWLFGAALPRHTAPWRRERVGRVTFVVAPGYPFDPERARRGVAFADSLAHAFALPRAGAVTYYVGGDAETLHRAMGVDWEGTDSGSYADLPNARIFSGDPVFGEEHRHEWTHLVLGPLLRAGRTHPMVNEGVAAWLGGSVRRDFPALMREYAAYLRERPALTLEAVLSGRGADPGVQPAGAALALLAWERGGAAAVRDLFTSGRTDDDLRAAASRILGEPWEAVGARWHERILRFAETSPAP